MKHIVAILFVSMLLGSNSNSAELPEAECPIQGELVHWIADYCMLTLGTDDEIAAGDCIARELVVVSDDQCKSKQKYKRAMCKAVATRDRKTTTEQCMADRSFAGSVVTNEGVGAQQITRERTE